MFHLNYLCRLFYSSYKHTMVHFAYIQLAIIATIIPLATANNCRGSYQYCGSSLLKKGNIKPSAPSNLRVYPLSNKRVGDYFNYIVVRVIGQGMKGSDFEIDNSLFRCVAGSDGDIDFVTMCSNGCVDAGWDKSDYCA